VAGAAAHDVPRHDVYSNPATSRGGFEVLMQANLIEPVDLKAAGPARPRRSTRRSKPSRSRRPTSTATSPTRRSRSAAGRPHLKRRFATSAARLFDPAKAIPIRGRRCRRLTRSRSPRAQGPAFDDNYDGEQHTTSFEIVDKFGNAVGCTPTLGGLFGNNVVVGNTGLLLNNGMRIGSTSPYPHRRQLRGRRQDSDPQQLAGRRAQGRRAGLRVRHARRRDHRPDRVPGAA
jgi:gamma-glutamyltranspeptidase/glutathione hydrolase